MLQSLKSSAALAAASVLAMFYPMQSPSIDLSFYRPSRSRTKGEPGIPGAKLARKAAKGKIGRNYIR